MSSDSGSLKLALIGNANKYVYGSLDPEAKSTHGLIKTVNLVLRGPYLEVTGFSEV